MDDTDGGPPERCHYLLDEQDEGAIVSAHVVGNSSETEDGFERMQVFKTRREQSSWLRVSVHVGMRGTTTQKWYRRRESHADG